MGIKHLLLNSENNTDSVVGIANVWNVIKLVSVFCLAFVLLIGCGEQNLDDPKVREKILAEAIDFDNLQTRRAPSGEELPYAPNQEQPYTGWVKSKSFDIINDNISEIISPLDIGPPDSKKIILILLARFPGNMELAQYQRGKLHGFYINWWDSNQQNFLRGAFLSGKLHGLVTTWYTNGQKASEVSYKNGQPDGLLTAWYEDGQKKFEGTYKNGQKDGLWTGWNTNGQKAAEGTCKNGQKDGLWTEWYENGQKKREQTYKNGKKDGTAANIILATDDQ